MPQFDGDGDQLAVTEEESILWQENTTLGLSRTDRRVGAIGSLDCGSGDYGSYVVEVRTHLDATGRTPRIAFHAPRKERASVKILCQETNRKLAKNNQTF